MKAPAIALSRVDFPEPLVPMTTTQAPSSTARSTPLRAGTSLGLCGLKVFARPHASSIGLEASILLIHSCQAMSGLAGLAQIAYLTRLRNWELPERQTRRRR